MDEYTQENRFEMYQCIIADVLDDIVYYKRLETLEGRRELVLLLKKHKKELETKFKELV